MKSAKDYLNEWKQQFPESVKELEAIEQDPEEVDDRFGREISFGTAGLRGKIGAGRNRMNEHTVGVTAQGYADFLVSRHSGKKELRVAIAHDPRHMSDEFTNLSAEIFAANGFIVYLYDDVRSTPQLSYTVREMNCVGGVMVTASHNPPEYNGYKVYDENGCQLVTELSNKVSECIAKVNQVKKMAFDEAVDKGIIRYMPAAFDDQYIEAVKTVSQHPERLKNTDLKTVFTPLHGVGGPTMKRLASAVGYEGMICTESQMLPDGDFPTTRTPNPEFSGAYKEAIQCLKAEDADMIIAVDPDSDRTGVMLSNERLLTGNELGALYLDYILSNKKQKGQISSDDYVVSTVVSSDFVKAICENYGVQYVQTLTGFKNIGNIIQQNPEHFVMGYEEAYGYLFSPVVRDKDAVMATMLAMEMAAEGSLEKRLDTLYTTYGYFKDFTDHRTLQGTSGAKKIKEKMDFIRSSKTLDFGEGESVVKRVDFLLDDTGLAPTNLVKFYLDEHSFVAFRPSGTEPKLKIYYSMRAMTEAEAESRLKKVRTAVDAIV